ncbi:hypothetical protein M9458_053620, partial [Cirrhinus mrigala]
MNFFFTSYLHRITYVTLVPRGNETLRLEPSFRHPSERSLHSPKLTPAPQHALLCFLVAYVISPLHVFRAWSRQTRSPSVSDAVSRSLGEPGLHT